MPAPYQYPIYRAPDVNLRQQIMEHLQSLYWADQFSQIKTSVETDESVLIPEGYQMIVMNEFTIDGGSVTIDGEFFILDMKNLLKWADKEGTIDTRTGATNPTWTQLGSGPFYAYAFNIGPPASECWISYHVPHDIGSNVIHFHAHWTTNGTDTNTVKWSFTYSFARGFDQEAFGTTGTTVTAEQAASGTAYQHMVAETDAVTIPTMTEPDGLILVYIKRVTNGGSDNGDTVYLLEADLHYQSNGQIGTTNKAPDFYA